MSESVASTWSRIEAGASALNMDQLAKAASALGVSLGDLMLEVDEIVQGTEKAGRRSARQPGSGSSASARAGGAAAVAFLGGAVLGGIITAMLANRNRGDEPEGDG